MIRSGNEHLFDHDSTGVLSCGRNVENSTPKCLALWKSGPVDSGVMTGLELPASAPRRARMHRPASRSGLAWLAVLMIIGVFLAVQVGRQVYANWAITQQAQQVRQQIVAIQAQNDALRRELEYLQSDAYVSAEARRLQNLGRSGEQVLIIPPGAEQPLPPSLAAQQEKPKPLLEQWLDLFFGA
jgi:cell division protein FtsB